MMRETSVPLDKHLLFDFSHGYHGIPDQKAFLIYIKLAHSSLLCETCKQLMHSASKHLLTPQFEIRYLPSLTLKHYCTEHSDASDSPDVHHFVYPLRILAADYLQHKALHILTQDEHWTDTWIPLLFLLVSSVFGRLRNRREEEQEQEQEEGDG